MKYTERVTIRLTQAQLTILKQRANDQGKTMTIVLREYIAIMLQQDMDDEL